MNSKHVSFINIQFTENTRHVHVSNKDRLMEANKRFLQSQFYMEEMNVYEIWKQKVNSESDEVWMSVQIKEFCEWRDKCDCTFLTKDECQTIINDLCIN